MSLTTESGKEPQLTTPLHTAFCPQCRVGRDIGIKRVYEDDELTEISSYWRCEVCGSEKQTRMRPPLSEIPYQTLLAELSTFCEPAPRPSYPKKTD